MAKKMFDNVKIRSTVAQQDAAVGERFDKADAIFIKASLPPAGMASTSEKKLVVRDTFSMPQDDFALIETIRTMAVAEGTFPPCKSEVVRAALQFLSLVPGPELIKILSRVEKLAPGRKKG